MAGSIQKATRFRAGQRLGATQLNRVVDRVNQISELPTGFGKQPDLAYVAVQPLQILSLNPPVPYTMLCVLPGQFFDLSPQTFEVELPQIFRETSRNFGGTIGSVSYVYTDINTRDATGPGGTETQYLTPPLLPQEIIQVAVLNDGVERYEMVMDGRMWAIDPPPP